MHDNPGIKSSEINIRSPGHAADTGTVTGHFFSEHGKKGSAAPTKSEADLLDSSQKKREHKGPAPDGMPSVIQQFL